MSQLLSRTEFPYVDGTLALVKYSHAQYYVMFEQMGQNWMAGFDNALDAMACFVSVTTQVFHDEECTVSPGDIVTRVVEIDLDYAGYFVEPCDVPASVRELFD